MGVGENVSNVKNVDVTFHNQASGIWYTILFNKKYIIQIKTSEKTEKGTKSGKVLHYKDFIELNNYLKSGNVLISLNTHSIWNGQNFSMSSFDRNNVMSDNRIYSTA